MLQSHSQQTNEIIFSQRFFLSIEFFVQLIYHLKSSLSAFLYSLDVIFLLHSAN